MAYDAEGMFLGVKKKKLFKIKIKITMWYEFTTSIFDECKFKFGCHSKLFDIFTDKLSIFSNILDII